MKKDQQEINQIIEGRANILAEILGEIHMWDVKEVGKTISIHMRDVLSDCLKPGKENIREEVENEKQEPKKKTLKEKLEEKQKEIYEKKNKLQEVILSHKTLRGRRKEAQNEVSVLNQELKRVNIALNSLQNEEEYILLKKFILNNYGEFILREFYKTLPGRKPKLN